jgi:hypothetical protein
MGETENLTLAELIQDPIIRLLMQSDGVDRSSIEAAFARIVQYRRHTAQSQ